MAFLYILNELTPDIIQPAQGMSLLWRYIHHHHHDVAIKEMGHLLTCSGLTHPGVSFVVFLGSFCLLGCSFLSVWVICYMAFDLHIVTNFSFSPVFCLKLGLYLILLQSLYLFYQFSLSYNRGGS
jgi:hypothetical protein